MSKLPGFKTLNDINRDDLIKHTMEVIEGSAYTNSPSDRGGKTRWGITESTAMRYKNLWPLYHFTGNMSELPGDLAKAIYVVGYWDSLWLSSILPMNPALAAVLFDIGVNSGTATAVKYLQRALNVLNGNGKDYPDIACDGGMGNNTIDALKAFIKRRGYEGSRNLTYQILSLQNTHYISIAENDASQESNSNGWSDRIGNALEYLVPLMLNTDYIPRGI